MVEAYYEAESMLLSNEEEQAKNKIAEIDELLAEPLSKKEAAMAADIYDNLGYVYKSRLNNYPQAFVFFNKGIRICDKYDIKEELPRLYLNIGTIYQCFEDSGKTLKYYEQAFQQAKMHNEERTALIALCSLLSYKMEAQDFNGVDNSMTEYVFKGNCQDTVLLNYTRLFLRGYMEMCMGRLHSASEIFELAVRNSGDNWETEEMKVSAFIGKAHALMRSHEYEQAAQELSTAVDSLDNVQIQGNLPGLYRLLSKAYASSGNKICADSIMNLYYKLNYDKFGAKGANALSDYIYEQEQNRHYMQMSNMASRQRQMWIFIIIGTIAMSIIIALLISLMRKEKRKSQLVRNLYRKIVASVPGEGVMPEILENQADMASERNCFTDKEIEIAEDEEFLSELYEVVKKSMASSDKIYELGFTINSLGELIGYQPYMVSKAINIIGHRNFATLLAEYRVAEACRRITDDIYNQYTIEAIGQSVGFKSRTNFAKVFKKITGLSPTEFKKEHVRPK